MFERILLGGLALMVFSFVLHYLAEIFVGLIGLVMVATVFYAIGDIVLMAIK